MSTFILTGMRGTVAPALARLLTAHGHRTVSWNRNDVPPENTELHEAFIVSQRPDWLLQIATGSPEWMAGTAEICRRNGINFLYTSSVSVFDGRHAGPFPVHRKPDAEDEYGRYKAECEQRVLAANPDALIVRLGWQIGDAPGSNNLVDYLERTQREHGSIEAGIGWIPSTAFLVDTVAALEQLMLKKTTGLYQLEGNPGWSFYEIVSALNIQRGSPWTIVKKEEPRRDIRMRDDRIVIGQLDQHLTRAR